ncbi:MAG: phosphatidate cytidylyltransferase [Halothiobacillaceae bacterium]|nr:phosphatidate cytidylyltransferase [Halothiobacillaceae bacterium]
MLKQRILTALVLGLIVLAALFTLPGWGFAAFVGLIVVLAAHEWQRLCALSPAAAPLYVVAVLFASALLFVFAWPDQAFWVALISSLGWLLLTLDVLRHRRTPPPPRSHATRLALGMFVIVPVWYAMVALHAASPWLLLYGMMLVWVADSLAFFVGRRFGQRKLAPALSPGKSVEGALGALAGIGLLSALAAQLPLFSGVSRIELILWSMLVAAVSVVGDLEESRLKREAGTKDSGRLLPGHGGVLDRVDSLTAALPVWLLALVMMGRIQ